MDECPAHWTLVVSEKKKIGVPRKVFPPQSVPRAIPVYTVRVTQFSCWFSVLHDWTLLSNKSQFLLLTDMLLFYPFEWPLYLVYVTCKYPVSTEGRKLLSQCHSPGVWVKLFAWTFDTLQLSHRVTMNKPVDRASLFPLCLSCGGPLLIQEHGRMIFFSKCAMWLCNWICTDNKNHK